MSVVRHVPIRWEPDFYRPFGTYSHVSSLNPFSHTVPSRNYADYEYQTHMSGPTTSYEVHSHSGNNYSQPMATGTTLALPTRFDDEFRRMSEEMKGMFQNMQKLQPIGGADDTRISENFRMDNPVIQDRSGKRKFHLEFDVRQFRPEEIEVKTFGNQLTIHAKHDEKDGGKSSYREYQRQFTLPKEVSLESLTSKLSSHGVLSIEAPLPALEGPRDKMIPIQHRKI